MELPFYSYSRKPSGRDLFVPARTPIGVFLLIMINFSSFNDVVLSHSTFVDCCMLKSQEWGPRRPYDDGLIAKNDRELFSSNRGVLDLIKACCIDELSRVSVLGYKILKGFCFSLP